MICRHNGNISQYGYTFWYGHRSGVLSQRTREELALLHVAHELLETRKFRIVLWTIMIITINIFTNNNVCHLQDVR
jgi:hypothetical protein